MKWLAAGLIAPLLLCGAMPGMGAVAELCAPMEASAPEIPADHKCCGPAAPAAERHATGTEGASDKAPIHEHSQQGPDCACQPADLPNRPESETPATRLDAGAQRIGTGAPEATLSAICQPDISSLGAVRCPDLARRFASSPPLYLLNDVLLI